MKILLNNLFTKEDGTRNINFSGFSELASYAVGRNDISSETNLTPEGAKIREKQHKDTTDALDKFFKYDFDENLNYTSVEQSIKSILAKKEEVLSSVFDRIQFNKDFEREFRNQLLNFGTDEQTIQKVLLGIRTSISTNLQPELTKGLVAMDDKISEIDNFNGEQSIMKAKINRLTIDMLNWCDSYDPHNKDKDKRPQPKQSAEDIINKYRN